MKACLSLAAWAGVAGAVANEPLLDAFVSYSIELSSFPDFAGNMSAPNTFTDTLLGNLGDLMGTKPYIRVGYVEETCLQEK